MQRYNENLVNVEEGLNILSKCGIVKERYEKFKFLLYYEYDGDFLKIVFGTFLDRFVSPYIDCAVASSCSYSYYMSIRDSVDLFYGIKMVQNNKEMLYYLVRPICLNFSENIDAILMAVNFLQNNINFVDICEKVDFCNIEILHRHDEIIECKKMVCGVRIDDPKQISLLKVDEFKECLHFSAEKKDKLLRAMKNKSNIIELKKLHSVESIFVLIYFLFLLKDLVGDKVLDEKQKVAVILLKKMLKQKIYKCVFNMLDKNIFSKNLEVLKVYGIMREHFEKNFVYYVNEDKLVIISFMSEDFVELIDFFSYNKGYIIVNLRDLTKKNKRLFIDAFFFVSKKFEWNCCKVQSQLNFMNYEKLFLNDVKKRITKVDLHNCFFFSIFFEREEMVFMSIKESLKVAEADIGKIVFMFLKEERSKDMYFVKKPVFLKFRNGNNRANCILLGLIWCCIDLEKVLKMHFMLRSKDTVYKLLFENNSLVEFIKMERLLNKFLFDCFCKEKEINI